MPKYYETHKNLILTLTLSGLYFPPIEHIIKNKCCIYFLKGLQFIAILFCPAYMTTTFKYFLFDKADFISKLFSLVLVIYSSFSTYIIFDFHYRKNDIIKLFQLWDGLFKNELFLDDRKKLLEEKKKNTDKWCNIFMPVTMSFVVIYFIGTFFHEEKDLRQPSGIPYRRQTPDYELVAGFEAITGIFAFAIVISYDLLTMAFLTMIESQLLHLKNSLAKIIGTIIVTDSGEIIDTTNRNYLDASNNRNLQETISEVEEKIKIWISHHNQLLNFHNHLQNVFAMSISMKFGDFLMSACLSAFLCLTDRLDYTHMVIAISHTIATFLLFYINITISDSIQIEGESLFNEAFSKPWYLYPKRISTFLKIITQRIQYPIQIKAFKVFTFSSGCFLKVLSSTYSLFTFLLQITKKTRP